MAHMTLDWDDVRSAYPGERDRDALQKSCDEAAKNGFALIQVVPQYRLWDDEGKPAGNAETVFVFRSVLPK